MHASAPLGLRHEENRLVDYDERWPALFELERARLATSLDGLVHGIAHYGSTSVPGLPAKPILDILVGVRDIEHWQACHDPLMALGYDYAEHAGVPGHHIFGRGHRRQERTHRSYRRIWRRELGFEPDIPGRAPRRPGFESALSGLETRCHCPGAGWPRSL